MKLTERQVEIRAKFRELVIYYWPDSKKPLMFNITNNLEVIFGKSVLDEMAEIPSIGPLYTRAPIQAWLARHFRAVSNAMFDGKTGDYALQLWKKEKYANVNSMTQKRSASDLKEMAQLKANNKINRAFGELHANMPDRWGKTSWNKVK